ncbi:hypothetical protein BDD12DRAFT_899815 [Trichophaea hybrida]|nr:hypothetical protein BDD12DRAFT_899815 [Trichophaea hybrida]
MVSPDPPFRVKALFDYTSPHEDDLNFPADTTITVTAIEDEDWYCGEYHDKASGEKKEGIFPKNFVERIVVEVPARPTRSTRKKTIDEPPAEFSPTSPAVESTPPPQSPPPVEKPNPIQQETRPSAPPPPLVEEPKPVPKPIETSRSPHPKTAAATKPPLSPEKPVSSGKPPPPDKPSSSSFKDRLALFNKGGAAPVTPFNPLKPRTDFVKKPFVPPPPSKNAYIPPAISHAPKLKRDEETRPPPPPVEPAVKASTELERDPEENKPKQSLKERIAMLQTQQLDPHSLPGGKPKPRPKPKRGPSGESELHSGEGDALSPLSATEKSPEDARLEKGLEGEEPEVPARAKRSVDIRREEIPDDLSVGGSTDISSASIGPREARLRQAAVPTHQSDFGDDEGANDTPDVPDSDDEEEEEEIDPEIQRKIALRERMMKMSGGMGMHGMFGPPMGMPMGGGVPVKKKSMGGRSTAGDEERYGEEREERSPDISRAPVSVLPFVMPRVQSLPAVEKEPEDDDEARHAPAGRKVSEDLPANEVVDVEDMKPTHSEKPHGPRPMPPRSPPSIHGDEPNSPERSVPPLPIPPTAESRPPPPPPSDQPKTPSTGSESGDEMSRVNTTASSKLNLKIDQPRAVPPPPPQLPTSRPSSSGNVASPTSPLPKRQSQTYFNVQSASTGEGLPLSPGSAASKRVSYQRGTGSIPPIPGGLSSPTVSRLPPPPPPRQSIDEHRSDYRDSDTEEEVTEYEADYDTDIANKVAHRDALTAQHGKDRRGNGEEDDTPHTSPHQAPVRAVPPPPPPVPSNPPPTRPSVDMPRVPPPMPPPAPPVPQESGDEDDDDSDDYDPYKYASPSSAHPPQHHAPPPLPPGPPLQHAPPPPPPPPPTTERLPSRGGSRQSMEVPRAPPAVGRPSNDPASRASMDVTRGPSTRRSMDQSRPHLDHVARDVDLAASSLWWTRPNTLPPVFQNRLKDLIFEMEESPTLQSGRMVMDKHVYILFHDYSQTIITARYDRDNPSNVVLEQRHEPPPAQPRQDQLEDFQTQFGAKIFNGVKSREGTVVGDGDTTSLMKELFGLVPDALSPVGSRGFGCLVYANIANASVQQYDEIRAGDIITFRNTRFQGHKGGLHQKYSMEVGKPDHVAVVMDWDGTKKKIRAYEQGRESKKIKLESFKVGDLRSGEVKVWRVAARSWVDWE